MTSPPEWKRPQTKHIQPSPKQPMTWPNSMIPIIERHHYTMWDKVWLNGQNITMTRPTKKLDHKWLGPYPVKKAISQSAYCLKLPSSFGQTHLVFSVML